jgi:glutathione S-transferase
VIRLYEIPYSTNVERVTLALARKGLEAEHVEIDPADRGPVRAVSGQDLVPVLEDEGEMVADSLRILRYIETRYPDPPLWPADPVAAARVDLFLDWFDRAWKGPPNEIAALLADPEANSERIGSLSALMAERLDVLARLLGAGPWFSGEEPGAADFAAFPFLKYAHRRDPGDDELFHRVLDEHQRLGPRHEPLRAWIERVDALPRA